MQNITLTTTARRDSLARNTRGAATKEYVIATLLIGVMGVGGFRAFGGAASNAIAGDAAGHGAMATSSLGGRESNPLNSPSPQRPEPNRVGPEQPTPQARLLPLPADGAAPQARPQPNLLDPEHPLLPSSPLPNRLGPVGTGNTLQRLLGIQPAQTSLSSIEASPSGPATKPDAGNKHHNPKKQRKTKNEDCGWNPICHVGNAAEKVENFATNIGANPVAWVRDPVGQLQGTWNRGIGVLKFGKGLVTGIGGLLHKANTLFNPLYPSFWLDFAKKGPADFFGRRTGVLKAGLNLVPGVAKFAWQVSPVGLIYDGLFDRKHFMQHRREASNSFKKNPLVRGLVRPFVECAGTPGSDAAEQACGEIAGDVALTIATMGAGKAARAAKAAKDAEVAAAALARRNARIAADIAAADKAKAAARAAEAEQLATVRAQAEARRAADAAQATQAAERRAERAAREAEDAAQAAARTNARLESALTQMTKTEGRVSAAGKDALQKLIIEKGYAQRLLDDGVRIEVSASSTAGVEKVRLLLPSRTGGAVKVPTLEVQGYATGLTSAGGPTRGQLDALAGYLEKALK